MIRDIFLKIIIFLIPTQLGLHFWPDFARLNGLKLDYYSPTIYLIDIFIFIFLLLNFSKITKSIKQNQKNFSFFFLLSLFNLYFSLNPFNTFFQLLRLSEYLFLYLVLSQEQNLWKKIKTPFVLSLIVVIFVQVVQQITQKSLNGVFYFLGERFFTASTPNLPKIVLGNTVFLRVSSLFSHPNSLAGFLALSYLILNRHTSSAFLKTFTFLSLILTFSKSAIFALLAYLTKINMGRKIYFLFAFLSLSQLFLPLTNTGFYSLDSRSTMLFHYQKLLPNHLFSGTGLGNYPTALENLLPGSMSTLSNFQPIHNLLLLAIIELGLPLTSFLFFYLYKNFNKNQYPVILIILLSGLFDHYWLTLPQNKLIFLLSLALFK